MTSFFNVQPAYCGETIGLDGKVLKGSYQIEDDNPNSDSHPAIMLVNGSVSQGNPVTCDKSQGAGRVSVAEQTAYHDCISV